MAFVSFVDTALVELVYTQLSQIVENTLYIRNNAPWTTATLDDLCAAMAEWWKDQLRPNVSDTVTLTTVRARDMSTQFGEVFELNPSSDNIGLRTSPALPMHNTVAIKFSTGLVGRRRRGRNYFVGLTEGQVTGNEVIGSELASIVIGYEQMPDFFPALSGWQHVVASRADCDPDASCVGDVFPVISYSADAIVDSQRRRLPGRGA